jgi:drug/metabolite transporter (DMT)-like permease
VIPILGGLGAALCWGASTVVASRSTRILGSQQALAYVMLLGFAALALLVPVNGVPAHAGGHPWAWALLAGAGSAAGLSMMYRALRLGKVGVVAPIASTEGAIAAVIAVLAGEQLAAGAGPILGLIAVGVVLAATGGGGEVEEGVRITRSRSLRAAGLAALAATMFGSSLYLTGLVSGSIPTSWVLLPARAVGTLVIGVPILIAGRRPVPRAAIPYIVVCGIVEVVGFTLFTLGAQVDIAITAVLASMFAPIAAIAAFVLFEERLARRQVAGIALTVTGIALLGFLSQ